MNEIDNNFRNLDDFLNFLNRLNTLEIIHTSIQGISANGISNPINNDRSSFDQIKLERENLRESILVNGVNSRHRAILLNLLNNVNLDNSRNLVMHLAEGITDLALFMRGVFPKVICSEFSDVPETINNLFPIPINDLLCMPYHNSVFDACLSCDVFEHLPDIDTALREYYRILKPNSVLLASFPMAYGQENSIEKARLSEGAVEYLMEPEFHGDPVNSNGVLVFTVPGWDILEKCRAAGFNDAYINFTSSEKFGILASDIPGVLTLVAKK